MKIAFVIILSLIPCLLRGQRIKLPVIYNHLKAPSSWADSMDWERYRSIEYIGFPRDSIYIGPDNNSFKSIKLHLITPALRREGKYRGYSKGRIVIHVYNKNIIKDIYDKGNLKIQYPCILNSYAVMVANIDSLPIDIAIFARRPIALEEEQNGIWRTIQVEDNTLLNIECNGDSHYFIKPGEIIIFTIPIIRNSHRNQRLRINKTYSNVFSEP